MTYITLAELKQQARVEDNLSDSLLTIYGNAAENAVITETRWTAEELLEMGNGTMPAELKVAMLMTGAHWFRCRESVSGIASTAIPYAYEYLVKPFVKLSDREEVGA